MDELNERLRAVAYAKTYPFCYSCYSRAETCVCKQCGSDDLMRELPGNGVEYGADWVVRELLSDLTPVDMEEILSDSIRECYGETVKVGWLELDTVSILKEHETDWRCALADEENSLLENGQVYTPDNGATYYWTHEVEDFCAEAEREAGAA